MPNIVINEIDKTTPGTVDQKTDIVFIPGFATRVRSKYENYSDRAKQNIPTLCTTIGEFERYFGKEPATFKEDQNWNYVRGTSGETDIIDGFTTAVDDYIEGSVMYKKDDVDPSYIYAKELIAQGIPVLYLRVNKDNEYPTVRAMYEALSGIKWDSARNVTMYVDSVYSQLVNKGEYTVKYITSGGYPTFGWQADGENTVSSVDYSSDTIIDVEVDSNKFVSQELTNKIGEYEFTVSSVSTDKLSVNRDKFLTAVKDSIDGLTLDNLNGSITYLIECTDSPSPLLFRVYKMNGEQGAPILQNQTAEALGLEWEDELSFNVGEPLLVSFKYTLTPIQGEEAVSATFDNTNVKYYSSIPDELTSENIPATLEKWYDYRRKITYDDMGGNPVYVSSVFEPVPFYPSPVEGENNSKFFEFSLNTHTMIPLLKNTTAPVDRIYQAVSRFVDSDGNKVSTGNLYYYRKLNEKTNPQTDLGTYYYIFDSEQGSDGYIRPKTTNKEVNNWAFYLLEEKPQYKEDYSVGKLVEKTVNDNVITYTTLTSSTQPLDFTSEAVTGKYFQLGNQVTENEYKQIFNVTGSCLKRVSGKGNTFSVIKSGEQGVGDYASDTYFHFTPVDSLTPFNPSNSLQKSENEGASTYVYTLVAEQPIDWGKETARGKYFYVNDVDGQVTTYVPNTYFTRKFISTTGQTPVYSYTLLSGNKPDNWEKPWESFYRQHKIDNANNNSTTPLFTEQTFYKFGSEYQAMRSPAPYPNSGAFAKLDDSSTVSPTTQWQVRHTADNGAVTTSTIFDISAYMNVQGELEKGNTITIKETASGGTIIPTKMEAIARTRGDCVAIIDHTPNASRPLIGVNSIFERVNGTEQAIRTDGTYGTIFTPWLNFTCPFTSTVIDLPPSFAYFIDLAKSIQNGNPNWLSVAGISRGQVPYYNRVLTDEKLTQAIADSYQIKTGGAAINAITNIKPYGQVIWGNRTLFKNNENLIASSFLDIRNMVSDIKKVVYNTAIKLIFEKNSDILWTKFVNGVGNYLDKLQSGEGITGYKIIKIATDEKAKLAAVVRISPIYSLEDVDVTIELVDEDVLLS